MTLTELQTSLRQLRLSGMSATLEARALQVAAHEHDFLEAMSWLVQDELDRRRSRLLDRRYAASGLPERLSLANLDWSYNPKLPKRDVLELGALKFLDAREDVLLIGKPGTGKSHVAKALALLAVQRGYRVLYREAHLLLEDLRAVPRASSASAPGSSRSCAPPSCSSSTTCSCADCRRPPATSSPTCS
jgi:DNA replication protein DnaC